MAEADERGLTLIELLITLVLFALVAGTLAATFAAGGSVWQRMRTSGVRDQWLQVGFDQLRRDVHHAHRFGPIPFAGSYDLVSFPALVPMETEAAGDDSALQEREVGRIGYYWDGARHRLCRSQQPYRVLARVRLKDDCQAALSDITRLRFAYYTFDPESETYDWSKSWSGPEPPLAVKVDVTYDDEATRKAVTQSVVIQIPVAPTGRPQPQ